MTFLVFYTRRPPRLRKGAVYDPSPCEMRFVGSLDAAGESACYRKMRGAAARQLQVRPMRPGDLLADSAMNTLFVKQLRGWNRVDLAAIKAALPAIGI